MFASGSARQNGKGVRAVLFQLILALACALPLTVGVAAPALADGTPVVIPLRYVPGISNYGPQDATGEADIVMVEGDVSITTKGLPPLTSDLYQAWLFNTKTGDRLSLGKFNADSQNRGQLQTVVDLSGKVFDLVAITVQPEPPPNSLPDSRLSIAGFFPSTGTPGPTSSQGNIPTPTPLPRGAQSAVETPLPTGVAGANTPVANPADLTPLPPVPAKLPSTGGVPPRSLALAGLILVGIGGLLAVRRGGRR